jgi:hypothetical protein
MTIDLDTLHTLEFAPTHHLMMEADMLVFRPHPTAALAKSLEPDTRPMVYMWLSPLAGTSNFDVLYVGKAGYGVTRRVSQHQSGFTHSGTGRDNRRLIAEWLATGRSIEVHRRVSAVHTLLGQKVSLYSAEEQALCECYAPRWNRARFPQVQHNGMVPPVLNAQTGSDEISTTFVTVPAEPAHAVEVDFSQLPQSDEIAAFIDSLDESKRAHFLSLCALLQRLEPEAGQKLVGGYSRQPSGYDGKPLYVFGHIGRDGNARRRPGWIPLTDTLMAPLTVIFPAKARKLDVDAALISEGSTGDWRPLNLSHFLGNVEQYLNLQQLVEADLTPR